MTPESGSIRSQNIEPPNPSSRSTEFLVSRLCLMDLVYHSQSARAHLINDFYKSIETAPKTADATIVLGTSPSKYPDKFKKRVYWGCQTIIQSRSPVIVFTGFQDNEATDTNQATSASSLAIDTFGLHPSHILIAGGNNTQQNFQEAANILSQCLHPIRSVLIVSDSRHLLRSHHVAVDEFSRYSIRPYPHPHDLHLPLNPDNPAVILECVKAVAYHHVHHNVPSHLPSTELDVIRETIDAKIKAYYQDLVSKHSDFYARESSFETWLTQVKGLE